MALGRQHHIIEVLREHCRREERNRSQRVLSDIGEVVLYWRRDGKNSAGADLVSGTVFHVQFPRAGDNVLRFFSGIGVPTKPFPGLNLIYDR